MQIFVNIDGGKTIALEVSPMDTIDNIKVKIKDKEGLMLDSYTLKYNNREVEEGRTLNDYDIKNESTLYLVTLQGALAVTVYVHVLEQLCFNWVKCLTSPLPTITNKTATQI